MKVLEKTGQILATLQGFELLQDIDASALQWLIELSEYTLYEKGELFIKPNEAVDHMQIILQGRYVIRMNRGGKTRELGVWSTGNITGVLPFSRMTHAMAEGITLEDTYVLALHRRHFTEMVNVSYELTQALVSVMTNRVRSFTTMHFQNEKLMALGKLSAGLAHELNNPASAMVRNAEELYKQVHSSPEKFKSVITMRISPEQTDQINAILFSKIDNAEALELSLLEREERVDDIVDWLEDHDIEDGEDIAETFVDFDISLDDLEKVADILGGKGLMPIMKWFENTLSLERLVSEIREASARISGLVRSIKDYSHMDKGISREAVDLHHGIKSTVIMLKHKFKKKNISLQKELQADLPKVMGYAGELNQVWTNIIVNALDAMPHEGVLTIRTYTEREHVRVDITDNGPGIPEDIQTRIFEPFFTTKAMGEGTGMGLDIVNKIMDRHDGVIELDSVPGRTTFTLCFPAIY
jgi:signal transduction histidine kinase